MQVHYISRVTWGHPKAESALERLEGYKVDAREDFPLEYFSALCAQALPAFIIHHHAVTGSGCTRGGQAKQTWTDLLQQQVFVYEELRWTGCGIVYSQLEM